LHQRLQLHSENATQGEAASLPLSTKKIGNTEIVPTVLLHSPNRRFVNVVGDDEYIIDTALAWRNKSIGTVISFSWAPDSTTSAILESKVKLKMYKNFKEKTGGVGTGAVMKGAGSFAIDQIYTGTLLGGRAYGFVIFWDWETPKIVRRIDVDAKGVRPLLCSWIRD
jgi:coatomer subunit beta'